MKHETIKQTCEELGMEVRELPTSGKRSYSAHKSGVHVQWSTSLNGDTLGLPRVAGRMIDTHARRAGEIKFLVNGFILASETSTGFAKLKA